MSVRSAWLIVLTSEYLYQSFCILTNLFFLLILSVTPNRLCICQFLFLVVLSCFMYFETLLLGTSAKSLQSCPTLCDPIDGSPTGSPHPWDSLGKNTGVGCHFLLQCMKVKSEREVAQSCPTLRDHMDCSLPGSSVHGIFQARVLEWVAIAFSI